MKTRLLIIVAVFLVMIPWIRGLEFGMNNQVMADGITISSITVMTLTIMFSLVSWILFSWASKSIKFSGILLSIITGASLIIPFLQVLGPMAGIIVGIVAGFVAFMLQKKIINPVQNTSIIIAAITIIATYFVLTLMILAIQTPSHVWNTGDGIGAWTGTAQGMEEKGFDDIFNNNIGFSYFLALIPSLIITWLIIQGKTTKSKFLIITGSIFIVSALLYIFVMSASGQCDLPLTFCTNFYESNLGGGSLDLDPDLSPSFASYEQQIFSNPNSIFIVVPIQLGIILLIFVSTHLILKKKKIPSRSYVLLVAAAIMLFIGIPNFIQGIMLLFMILINEHLWAMDYLSTTVPFIVLGFVLVGGGMALLAKSKLIRNFIEQK